MADVVEIDAETNEVIERDFTPEELAQRELDIQEYEATAAAAIADQEVKDAARASALSKLTALGLTEEEIASFTSNI